MPLQVSPWHYPGVTGASLFGFGVVSCSLIHSFLPCSARFKGVQDVHGVQSVHAVAIVTGCVFVSRRMLCPFVLRPPPFWPPMQYVLAASMHTCRLPNDAQALDAGLLALESVDKIGVDAVRCDMLEAADGVPGSTTRGPRRRVERRSQVEEGNEAWHVGCASTAVFVALDAGVVWCCDV